MVSCSEFTNKENSMKACRRYFINLLAGSALVLVSQGALAQEAPKVVLKTSMGEIILELYPDKAPKTVENFLQYVKSGFYNGTVFHRVINGFMVQGGGYDKNMQEKQTREPIQNEAKNGLRNLPYSIAMARTANPHSASAQFFINVNNNRFLDYPGQDGWGYAVFGKVITGNDVVDKIRAVETAQNDKPVKAVLIESATLVE
jgi:peptidyl-prolyl cis-trans isomerase A (cyclophilin A)/peptidyl-prolyl cis-trans isomerase B (cyclophilin B)